MKRSDLHTIASQVLTTNLHVCHRGTDAFLYIVGAHLKESRAFLQNANQGLSTCKNLPASSIPGVLILVPS